MALDLGELVDPLKREVNPPGVELFPDATEDEWIGRLSDAFWEARLHGMLEGFTEGNGSVVPNLGTEDLSRDLQQLIVFYAAYRTVRTRLLNVNTVFRAQAGNVSYETQQSAQLLVALLKDLQGKLNLVLERLSDLAGTAVGYLDAVISRDRSIIDGATVWVGGGRPRYGTSFAANHDGYLP